MVVGYGGRKIIMENNDTSYYGRILVKALATHYPDNFYILYSPENESNKRLTSILNSDAVRVKFPRNHIHNKKRWYTHNGIVNSAKAHGVNAFHGIDDGIASGFNGSNFPTVFTMTDPLFKSAKGWFERMQLQRRARKACKFTKRVIALNEVDRQLIIDHYHVNPDRWKWYIPASLRVVTTLSPRTCTASCATSITCPRNSFSTRAVSMKMTTSSRP